MRLFAFLLCLIAIPVQAQWVAFTPCGLKATDEIDQGYEAFSGPAENIAVVYIWAPAVVALVGFPESKHDDAVCSLIILTGQRVYVAGNVEEVRGWLENE